MFEALHNDLSVQIHNWEKRLQQLNMHEISALTNAQNRSIKQIVGHMVDSVSNNTHRVVHLQYGELPLQFPNYATYGNNDNWIKIQNYKNEDWYNLVQLWKYTHLHFLHVIQNIVEEKLNAVWITDKNEELSLKEMVEDFPRHFQLHVAEIEELLIKNKI